MRGKRIKQLRRLARESFGTRKPTRSRTFQKTTGQFLYPGDSIQGRYLELKASYKCQMAKGEKPWEKTNKGQMILAA